MPKILALAFCTIFVVILLRRERKQGPMVSSTLWIPTIWMLLIASKPVSTWFGVQGDPTGTGASLLDQVVLSGLLFVGIIILLKRGFDWTGNLSRNVFLMLLIGYMLVSISWSNIPFVSFKRWIRELTAIVMAFLVLSERQPREAMQSVFRRSVFILIPFSVLLVKYYPQLGIEFGRWSGERTWIGVTTQKNGLGRLCLISAFFLIWSLVKRWQRHETPVGKYSILVEIVVLAITLWLLKASPGSYSATGIVALASGLVVFFSLSLMKKYRVKLGANLLAVSLIFVIGYGIATVMLGGSTVASFTSALGRDTTLTGRSDIWAGLLPAFTRRPIFGNGFGGFWTNETRELYVEAHSGYLGVLLELGCMGMLLLTMFLVSSGRNAQRELSVDFHWASLSICFLFMALVHNISESSLNSLTSHLTAIVLFLSVSLSASTRRTKETG